ncbi:AtpZ/AtpI family protein [Myxococcota bacterium]|nr:AtpZ/AtpI family protein [Myxococcota bacterium]MBU1431307.1 AtpZ/AtpI family protein [Myxococcota bacterium]MBU1898929.1 AtpZ/AtpI family protein [Myxococcota bacterium]
MKPEPDQHPWKSAQLASLGLEMGISVALGYLGGAWIEGRWGGAPWGSTIGVILGFIAGLRALIRAANKVR